MKSGNAREKEKKMNATTQHTVKKVFRGDFQKVKEALGGGMCNLPSDQLEDGTLDDFLREHGLAGVPHLFLATHSIGGREWELEEGRTPAFFPEPAFNGGWLAVQEEDVKFIYLRSATSGSCLTAVKSGPGDWTITLEVPLEGEEPYRGSYWAAFHEACA